MSTQSSYLSCVQLLAVGIAFTRSSAAKTYRHRADSLSTRWQDQNYFDDTERAASDL
jgi:hypothetical protein